MPTSPPAKPIKHAVAFYWRDQSGKLSMVKRPSSDKNFPNTWSLPAGSVMPDETPEAAVKRSARERLGIEVEILRFIGEDQDERSQHILHMREYEVNLIGGQPKVPRPDPSVKQYTDFAMSDDLQPVHNAADKGSLCSRIFLGNRGLWP